MPVPGDPGWVAALPTYDQAVEKRPTRNWFTAGLSSGVDDLQSLVGSAGQGAGKLFGLRTLEDAGRGLAQRNNLESAANGRPDLETAPWKDGGAPVLPWLGYQAAKQVPLLATYMLGGSAYKRLGGAIPEIAEQLGTALPRALGGGGVTPGASFAVRRAAIEGGAREAGKDFAQNLIGGSIAGIPIAYGSMIQEADNKPGGVTVKDAQRAALLSPIYSALDAAEPAGLKGLFSRGQTGNIIRRIATASLAGAAAEVPQEGLQTALEQSFRPDLSPRDKFYNIVDAAVTGGAVGGVFGSAGGIRGMKRVDPSTVHDDDIASAVDQVLGLPSPQAVQQRPPASNEAMVVNQGGDASARINPIDFERSEFDTPRAPRPYENVSVAELKSGLNAANKAIKSGTASDDVLRFADAANQELETRNNVSTSDDVNTSLSRGGDAQSEPSAGDGGTVSAAPAPVSQPWDVERDTLLKGISTRKWYREASTPEELDTVLRARLENGSTAKSDFELAKRRGINLDETAAPVETASTRVQEPAQQTPATTVAGTIESLLGTSQPSRSSQDVNVAVPQAPVTDENFTAQWKTYVQKTGQRDKAARAIKPTDEVDAQRKLYEALGREGEVGDGLERLAQKYGVLDENKRLTPLAVDIASKDPISTEEAVKAARSQGFKGAQASMFDRGVQAHLGSEQITKFDSNVAQGAYEAGQQWAQERNSVPEGVLKKYNPAAHAGEITDAQVAAINGAKPQPRVVPAEQKKQQLLNSTLDSAISRGDLTQDEAVPIKRLVAQGAVDVDEAIRYTKSGRGALLTDNPASKPFKPVVLERGGQAERVISEARTRQAGLRIEQEIEADKHAKTAEEAIQRKKARDAVSAHVQRLFDEVDAEMAAERDSPQELRVDDRGVLRSNQVKVARREFLTGVGAAIAVGVPSPVKAALKFTPAKAALIDIVRKGGAALPALQHIRDNSSDPSYRMIAAKLLRGDWSKVDLWLMPRSDEARGSTHMNNDGSSVITIFGEDGLNEQTILHELIHAFVQQRWSGIGTYLEHNKELLNDTKDRHDKEIQRFRKLWGQIGHALVTTHPELVNQQVWASETVADPDEMLAWVLTNPDAQAYLKTVDADGHRIPWADPKHMSLWDKVLTFFADLFGTKGGTRSALNTILSAGYSVLDAGADVGVGDFNARFAQRLSQQSSMMRKTPRAPAEFDRDTKGLVSQLTKAVPIESATAATRRTVFGWNTIGHLVAHYAKQFPQLALYAKAHLERRATQARWAQLFEAPYETYEQLERTNPKAAETIRYLMSLTQFEIDPTRTWAQHEHLQGAANESRLKELTDDANRKYNVLRGKGQSAIYDDLRAMNEATHLAMMSVSLHNLVASDPVLKQGVEGFGVDPTDAFRGRAALHESPQNAQRYWSDTLDNQVKRADEYITQLRGEPTGSVSEKHLQSMRLEPIEMRIRSIRESLNAMRNAPYFHLGRHGEHFVSFTLRLGDDKKNVDPAAIERAGKAISDAGFKNIEISRDSTKPNVYIRTETIEARHKLEQVVKQLRKDGWLKPDSEIKAAPRTDASDTGTADKAPAWLEKYIELLQASPMFDPTDQMTDVEKAQMAAKKAQMVSHARELWLDMLPDTAIAKVMVHRHSVPGFDKDMIRNFAFRFQVGVNSLANLSASAKLTDAFTQMRAAVFDAQKVGSDQHGNVDLLQALLSEALVHEAQRPLRSGASWVDTLRALNHAFFLGFSPSYVMVNTTQLGVLLWPELAKKHGFAKSAKAIAAVTGTAFNIMKETFAAGARVGPKRALDAVITEKVLQRAKGVDEATADFLMKLIADGIIDIGGSSRELGRVADGSVSAKLDTGLRWAAAFGLYSETFTRLVAGLAARKLNGDDLGYAHQVIEESMLNYSDWNTARQMGKLGFAGPMTKVMTAFMQYNAQVLQKLYREFHTVISGKASATEKAEARRFLAAHAVAVTTLAGTLGLPFATVAATVVEKLVDLFDDDDEPFDASASWRNFMASIFGKEIGEIVSRGAPREAGFDLSQRTGEQNLIPFTQFMTDKRKWREAATEQSLRSMGAPVSMLLNLMQGGEMIGNGDLVGGAAMLAPMAIKGPVKAYQMTSDGYVDTLGNKLPMTPGSGALLAQLLGLTPQAKAEYSEARGDQAARKGELMGRAKVMRDQLVDALLSNDTEKARGLIADAQKFDKANPKFAVLPDIESSIQRRMRAQALSQATNTPIGVAPDDIDARALTNYADVEYRAH